MLSKQVMDRRFAEKMKARKEGRTPVFVAESPLPSDPVKAADARIRDKIKRHFDKTAPAVVESKPEEEAAKPTAGDKPAPEGRPKAQGKATKPTAGDG